MSYIITGSCAGVCDSACVNVCPVDCIYPAEGYSIETENDKQKMRADSKQLYIHPDECIECGACEPECPVEAIFPEDDVPNDQQDYIRRNYERFGMKP